MRTSFSLLVFIVSVVHQAATREKTTMLSLPAKSCNHSRTKGVLLFVGLALGWLALLVWNSQASASDAAPSALTAPDVPGSIRGRLVNEKGEPVSNVFLALYRYPFVETTYGDISASRRTTVDANGVYSFTLLPPGLYRLKFSPSSPAYAPQFYADAVQLEEANDIGVFGADVAGIDAVLHPAGKISGSLTITDNADIYTIVDLYVQRQGRWRFNASTSVAPYQRDFRLVGLASGPYRLCATGYARYELLEFLSEPTHVGCYGLSSMAEIAVDDPYRVTVPVEKAQTITVTYGVVASGIDITLIRLNTVLDQPIAGNGIAGRIVNEAGAPVSGIEVYAYRREQGQYPIQRTITNRGGYYLLPLPSGDYRIGFFAYYGDYFAEFYDNVRSQEEAALIKLEANQRVEDINATLGAKARIRGNVKMPSGLQGHAVSLTLYRKADDGSFYPEDSAYVLPDRKGAYRFKGLDAGIYRVDASIYLSQDYVDRLTGFYGGATLETSADIMLSEGELRTEIDIEIGAEGADFEGLIAGKVSSQGAPLVGIKVDLFRKESQKGPLPAAILYTTTNSSGEYRVAGLTNGVYYVKFSDPSYVYATGFYKDQPTLERSTPIMIAGRSTFNDVGAELMRAGEVHGRLLRYDGKPLAGAEVALHRSEANTGLCWSCTAPVESTTTDGNGGFTFRRLAPANYGILFSHPSFSSAFIPYGTFNANNNQYEPEEIVIASGQSADIEMIVAAPTALGAEGEPRRSFFPWIMR
jgi:5-hydroxyisourate hydrolase-like protein (transthyretin family)